MAMSAWRGAGLRSLLGGGGAAAAAVGKGASRRMSAAAASVHVEQHAAAAAPAAPRKGVREVRSANGVTAEVRNDWTKEEISAIYNKPLIELMYQAATVHRLFWDPREVQQCTLLSIKTGGCTEDCKYCSQSVRYKTFVKPTPQMKVDEVLEAARRAKAAGSTRFCMGAAWRELGNKRNAFKHVLEMVQGVSGMGMEVCCTLGMLTAEQAQQLKSAGLSAYNHNLDTSPEHYPSVITTRSYEDRLQTIANVRDAGISVCCGGILGLGEKDVDRVSLLHVLATLPEHPESVPVNALVAVEGTPLGDAEEQHPPSLWDMARMIATARIVMPRSMVRLSAGRLSFSDGEQALLFMSGANSIFNGDKLLTTPNPELSRDAAIFEKLGLQGKKAFQAPRESVLGQDESANVKAQQMQQQPRYSETTMTSAGDVVITRSHAEDRQHLSI